MMVSDQITATAIVHAHALQVRSGTHFPKVFVSRPQTPGGDVAGIVEDADESSLVPLLSFSEIGMCSQLQRLLHFPEQISVSA